MAKLAIHCQFVGKNNNITIYVCPLEAMMSLWPSQLPSNK